MERKRNLEKHRNSLSDQIHQEPKRISSRTRISSGKENFFLSDSCDPTAPWESRSPLPEGFPRIPLQDITDILSPVNVLLLSPVADCCTTTSSQVKAERDEEGQENAGQGVQKRKKTKKESLNVHLSVESRTSERLKSTWEGLTQCSTVMTAIKEIPTQQPAKAEEETVKAVATETGVAQATGETREPKMGPNMEEGSLQKTREKKRRLPTNNRSLANPKTRSNVMKFR